MGPAPSLTDYQSAAQAQYEPQLAADITTGKANTAAEIANLESGKGQINTDFTSAIQNLKNTVQSQTAQISQLYSSRLLGNFSGLQGNDMGMMFSKANQQQATIESTRANKLASITTQETNAQNANIANESALRSKYQGLEAGAASSGYDAALKAYNSQQLQMERMAQTQANSDRSYALSAARFGNSQQQQVGKGYSVGQYSSGNKYYKGPNGQTNLYQYASALSGGDPNSTYQEILHQLSTGSNTDKTAYNKIRGMSQDQGVAYLQKNNKYIFQ